MKTYSVHTLGCKVNQYESQQIRQALEQIGFSAAERSQSPSVIVVNTCCVTHIASAKSRQCIRKAQQAHPDSMIIVTGCLPAGQDNELKNLSDILIIKDKNTLPAIFDRLFREQPPDLPVLAGSKPLNNAKIKDKKKPLSQIIPKKLVKTAENDIDSCCPHDLPPLEQFTGQCRAFLKVQDGCDAYCTYCIIPKIRQNVCNKDVKSVLEEAKRLIAAGHKEIVLTGIFLGAYGQATARRKRWDRGQHDALADLVDAIASLDDLRRLRLSSLEPLDVTERLLEVMTAHPNIMPHLHLSLQSGSDNVLRKMARQYRIDDFLRIVERTKAAFDRPAITTDIIVGFPGETETDFEQTIQVAETVGFAKIHVFSFSPRKNTAAIKMAKLFGKLDAQELKRRSTALQEVDKRLQAQFRQSCKGLAENVLIETTQPLRGRCTRYFMVDIPACPNEKMPQKGDIIRIAVP